MTYTRSSVCILGSGESGMGALRLARKQGLKCFMSDSGMLTDDKKREIENLGATYEEGKHTIETIQEYDEVVKSPGIPDTAPIIDEILDLAIPIISEIEFASRYTTAKIIGITGSNGKTTTTLLTTHLLASGGIDVISAGNVGNSLSNALLDHSPAVLVLELSSFQLEDVEEFRPDIAMMLNLTPDHMDRYDHRMDLYADAKFNMVQNMRKADTLLYNADDKLVKSRARQYPCTLKAIRLKKVVTDGAYADKEHLVFNSPKVTSVLSPKDLPLVGKHNLYNQMFAIQAALEMGLTVQQIQKGLATFKNAAHRLEVVENINSLTFINDSKATNVDAVYYALEAMKSDVVWIAGGVNKGNDYDQIMDLVKEKVRVLICLGKDNEHLIEAFNDHVDILHEVESATEAVEAAMRLGQNGETVLLSPACASFDLFKNYEDRGNQFKAAVRNWKNPEPSKPYQS